MGEMRLYEPVDGYLKYYYHNGKTYITVKKVAEMLGVALNTFEVTLSNCRLGKNIVNREWIECILSTRIEYNGAYWYDRDVIEAYKYFRWEQEDFIYKMLYAIDDILDNGIMTAPEFCGLVGIQPITLHKYQKLESKPNFEMALKIYKKLKGKQYEML